MVFLSIIIPFNKSERYFIDCLDSLAEQNLSDSEIIVIVNGYSDPITDILDNYSNFNLNVIQFDDEIGVSKARNEGLKVATGEYVYFIDSDDYLYSDALSKLLEVAHASNADFINGERINTLYIRDRIEEQKHIKNENQLSKEGMSDLEFAMTLLVGTKTNRLELLSSLHSLIKRDKIKTCFNESKRYYADYDFMIDVIRNCNSFIGVENAIYIREFVMM